jgi:hypothetical protein
MPAPHPRRRWRFTLASAVSATLLAVVAGCGESSHAGNAAGAPAGVARSEASATTAASSTPSASASTPTKAASSTPSAGASTPTRAAPATAAVSSTPSGKANASVTFMGKSTVSIGAGMADASAAAAPFDVRYQYLVSPPAPSSDLYTAKSCPSGVNWWGCVFGARGGIVPTMEARAAQATYQGHPHPQTMMWTWFVLPDLLPAPSWQDEVKAVDRVDLLTRYLNDYRFFLQKIGTSHDMIDLEPDFWGFARGMGNLNKVPAQVTAAAPNDCANQENSVAGLAHCLIAMTRKYAPNAAVGLHLSCWDWPGNVERCGTDYLALGATGADFLVGEVEDADAGLNATPARGAHNSFWTDQQWAAQLAYWKAMTQTTGKPVVVWQIPLGNMRLNNTVNHYQDDKVDWLFSHMDQVASAHVAGLLFGPGQPESTTVESDGGNLFAKTIAYRNSGGTRLK